MPHYGFNARIVAQPGRGPELRDVLLTAAAALEDDADCLLYTVAVPPSAPDEVHVTEVWTTKEAHDASLRRPGVAETVARGRPLIADFMSLEVAVAGGKGIPA